MRAGCKRFIEARFPASIKFGDKVFEVSGDLAAQVDEDNWELVTAGELATIGSWPAPGGWLQQAAAVVTVTRLIMQENKLEAMQWAIKMSISR